MNTSIVTKSYRAIVLAGTALSFPAMAMAQSSADEIQTSTETPAPAAQMESGQPGEIVVTAQRRSESLQRVPISVAVVTAGALEQNGITGVQNIKIAAPGVEVQANNGYAVPIIRGVGSKALGAGIETPVAFYVDGVYVASSNATILSFNNIAQIEVLKGPQGTLFGRNATGGLIQVLTRDPKEDLGGEIKLGYGSYQTFNGTGYLTGGIAENLAADIAATVTTMGDGYGKNLFSGKDVYRTNLDLGLRSKWLWRPGADTEVRLIGDYSENKGSMNASRVPLGTTAPAPYTYSYGGGRWDINADTDPRIRVRQGGASLRVDQDFSAFKLASITAYRRSRFDATFDLDYTPVRGRINNYIQKDWQFSQELQLLSKDSGPVTWVAGLYYFKARARYPYVNVSLLGAAALPTDPPTILATTKSAQTTDSISGFGQATAEIAAGLKATAGLRYTSEKRALEDATAFNTRTDGSILVTTPLNTRSNRFKKLTWRLALDYQATDDILLYASYNRGFKSGGFNPGALTIAPFEPEVLDAYEAGVKSQFLDRRLTVNASGFYYDYRDVQVNRIVNGATGIYNGASARVYGAEVELSARITDAFDLRVGYQYLDSRYKQFNNAVIATPRVAGGYTLGIGDVSGNRMVLSPKSTLSVNASYRIPLGSSELTLNGGYYYNSGYFHEPDNVVRQPAYSQFNASASLALPDGYSILIWGNNLTNKAVATLEGIQSFGATGAGRQNLAPPRTYGVTVGKKF